MAIDYETIPYTNDKIGHGTKIVVTSSTETNLAIGHYDGTLDMQLFSGHFKCP